ncbi:MAG: hypothetical protein AB7P23_06320 [Amphiplicatus sp.]
MNPSEMTERAGPPSPRIPPSDPDRFERWLAEYQAEKGAPYRLDYVDTPDNDKAHYARLDAIIEKLMASEAWIPEYVAKKLDVLAAESLDDGGHEDARETVWVAHIKRDIFRLVNRAKKGRR